MLYLLINRTSNSIIFHLLSLLKDLNFRNLTKYSIKTYLFPFELAGLILLLAIIAAISLGAKYNRGKIIVHSKEQIIVTEQSRLKIIKMASEKQPGVTTHD